MQHSQRFLAKCYRTSLGLNRHLKTAEYFKRILYEKF